jgi:hypothetical protein
MTEPVTTEEARGLLGFMRKLLHAPELTAQMGCGIASGAAVALTMVLIYLAMNLGGSDTPAPSNPEPPATQTSEAPAAPTTPIVENPTAVGQAVDAIAQPAIADEYGEALLSRASAAEALIVRLWYDIRVTPAEGDDERLRDKFIERGARVDPDNSETDYHAGAEFMLLIDTGNPANKTVRVGITPDANTVYVNADKSE